jgi:hypothetical protein
MRTKRRLLVGLLLTPIPLLCVCIVGGWAIINYDKLGRISDFTAVTDGLQVPGTPYSFAFVPRADEPNATEVRLRNSQTHSETGVSTMYYSFYPAYRLLQHSGKSYLLFKLDNGGSAGGYIFNVLDITSDPPRYTFSDDNLLAGVSCTYPRLEGDSLEFESAEKCDQIFWDYSGKVTASSYWEPLD